MLIKYRGLCSIIIISVNSCDLNGVKQLSLIAGIPNDAQTRLHSGRCRLIML